MRTSRGEWRFLGCLLQTLDARPARYLCGLDMGVLAAAAMPLLVFEHQIDQIDLGVGIECCLEGGEIYRSAASRSAAAAKIAGSDS